MAGFPTRLAARGVRVCGMLAVMLVVSTGLARAADVELLWLGHAATRITSVNGKVIFIDPFLTQNPTAPAKYKDLAEVGKVDLILVTHGHTDHAWDLPELARLSDAKVVGNFEYVRNLAAIGKLKAGRYIAMNKGGTVEPLGRGIKVHMVHAEHSSNIELVPLGLNGTTPERPTSIEGGTAVGYVVELENGFKIYHSGDTAVFGDMALIREFFHPDLALVPIGGYFTMDPEGAAYAVKELLKPKMVLPIHYGTYPVINRTPAEFKKAMGSSSIKVLDLAPGQTLKF